MPEYTYKDVIIDPEDPRVEIGKEYYFGDFPKEALEYANKNGRGALLEDIDLVSHFPFLMENFDESAPCLIRKKEPEKKYVPFDLSDPEVRKELMGKVITAKDRPFSIRYAELTIGCFELRDKDVDGVNCLRWLANGIEAEELVNEWKFADGSPCGKLVEEE